MKGQIITFGQRAATIQTDEGHQFYAPCEELSRYVINDLLKNGAYLNVTFKIDKTRTAGHSKSIPSSKSIPRYYATHVELQDILFF